MNTTNKDINKIDLVVTWLDDNDVQWLNLRNQYKKINKSEQFYFRNWELMRYWFRCVEQNLPWIRKIHFVTWGHLPAWLDTNHPKIHIVHHDDYIPKSYLPTFSANPIELNMHKIEDLSEYFIYSNDDTYFIGKLTPKDYFVDGLPCDCIALNPITENCKSGFGHILWNNITVINNQYKLRQCINEHYYKWFNRAYPEWVINRNQWGYSLHDFPGFYNDHCPLPFLKSSFEKVWNEEYNLLNDTCLRKFRSNKDVSDWLVRYWQLAEGQFYPYIRKGSRSISVGDSKEKIRDTILSTKYKVICLNDTNEEIDFEERKAYIHDLFEIAYPNMSSFEKW